MDFEAAQQRVEALRERIEYHSKRYYDEDAPEIEDDEFDVLTRELRELEAEYPQLITADSYTQRIQNCPICSPRLPTRCRWPACRMSFLWKNSVNLMPG